MMRRCNIDNLYLMQPRKHILVQIVNLRSQFFRLICLRMALFIIGSMRTSPEDPKLPPFQRDRHCHMNGWRLLGLFLSAPNAEMWAQSRQATGFREASLVH